MTQLETLIEAIPKYQPGADLAVLDRDIRAIPAREIADAAVVLTVAGGRVVHG